MLVFDTNIWVSYALTPESKTAILVKSALENHPFAFSEATFTELTEVLLREKFDPYVSKEGRIAFLKELSSKAEWYATKAIATECRDKNDNKFLDLARTCAADYLITGDNDLLVLSVYEKTPILTLADFAEI